MLVKDVMCDFPQFIPPETTLREAAERMRDYDFGFLPVGENDRLIGMVTDRDIAIRAIADGLDPNTTTVRDIMSQAVLYCWEGDSIEDAADSMEDNQVRRLIVLDENKRMTGILSIGDIARRCHNDELCGELIEEISKAA